MIITSKIHPMLLDEEELSYVFAQEDTRYDSDKEHDDIKKNTHKNASIPLVKLAKENMKYAKNKKPKFTRKTSLKKQLLAKLENI